MEVGLQLGSCGLGVWGAPEPSAVLFVGSIRVIVLFLSEYILVQIFYNIQASVVMDPRVDVFILRKLTNIYTQ